MSDVTMRRGVLFIAMILIVAGCRSSGSVSAKPLPPVRATFTRMSDVVIPGPATWCPTWTLTISRDGTTAIDVSDGQRSVLSRRTVIPRELHEEIVTFLDAHLPPSARSVVVLATDRDSGSIELGNGRILSAEGATQTEEPFAEFYTLIRYLEHQLEIPNPWCE